MKISEFIEKNKDTTNLETILEVRTYIPIAEKRAILEDILDGCYVIEDGVLSCDYVLKRMMFELAMIKYHTDLDIDITSEEDYDAIQKAKVELYELYAADYEECQFLFDGMERELCSQYSIESSIARLTNKFSNIINGLAGDISQKVKEFDVSKFGFEEKEFNQFKDLLNKYGK